MLGIRNLAARLASIALCVGFASAVNAEQPEPVTLAAAVVVTAEVVGIDSADRVVTLVGPRGNVVDIEAGEEVRNFDQIEVGDKVKVTYYESVTMYLGVPGSQPTADAAQVAGRAAKGDKPGAMVMGAVDVSATVMGIDKGKRELTLKMPDGHMVHSEVDPAVKGFDKIKVGDTVHARMTRAVAISVEGP